MKRYSELSDKAKRKAQKDYVAGWKEFHPKDRMTLADADECCRDGDVIEWNLDYYEEDGTYIQTGE